MPTEIGQPRFGHAKLGEAEAALEPELRAQFRSLVEDLHFHALKRDQHPIRNWPLLADLIRAGWRGPAVSKENAP